MPTLHLYLYGDPASDTLDVGRIAAYTLALLPAATVEPRGPFVRRYLSSLPPEEYDQALALVAENIARSRVLDLARREEHTELLPAETAYETRRLSSSSRTFGLLYDGFRVMDIFASLLPRDERNLGRLHIVFTNQILATWEEADRRYHARVAVFGNPCLISTSGLVEAPAKPREYYLLKQQYQALGMYDAEAAGLEARFASRFIAHDDLRLTEAIKGYVMQCVFHHLTGHPFCESPDCRLYNAHRHEEVIRAQLGQGPEFCPTHEQQLLLWRNA